MEDKDINNLKEIVDLCEKEIKNNNYNATATLDITDLKALNNLLNELERLQKEFELLDHECSRLEQKEIILEKENERYKELMYALETYYSITEEDLEKCVKEDR